jgi:hypothetical protein
MAIKSTTVVIFITKSLRLIKMTNPFAFDLSQVTQKQAGQPGRFMAKPLALLSTCAICAVHQADRPCRDDRRYRMLVNKLLFPFGIQHNGKAIKSCDHPAQLKPVHKKNCDLLFVASCLVEKNVL